jgi:hypothetical protein
MREEWFDYRRSGCRRLGWGDRDWSELECGKVSKPIEVTTVSPQLQQVLNEARQLPPQELRQLVAQLIGEADLTNGINDDRPEAELEYVDGILVVKSQGPMISGDWVTLMREERIQALIQRSFGDV